MVADVLGRLDPAPGSLKSVGKLIYFSQLKLA